MNDNSTKIGKIMVDALKASPFDWPITLHADLNATTLADFDEHYSNALLRHDEDLLGKDVLRPPNAEIREDTQSWQLDTEEGETTISRHLVGTTGIGYVLCVTVPEWGGFVLTAVHYSRDTLKIVLREVEGGAFEVRLRRWLLARWGGNCHELPTKDAPPQVLPEVTIGRPKNKCNVWAREQFDAGKTRREIADEYAERYNQETDNETPPETALKNLHRRWKRQRDNNG